MYLARRHLHMGEGEWDALSWASQRMFYEGMLQEGLFKSGEPEEEAEGGSVEEGGIAGRQVDTGDNVFDLRSMADGFGRR